MSDIFRLLMALLWMLLAVAILITNTLIVDIPNSTVLVVVCSGVSTLHSTP